jgi:hypothetical protein
VFAKKSGSLAVLQNQSLAEAGAAAPEAAGAPVATLEAGFVVAVPSEALVAEADSAAGASDFATSEREASSLDADFVLAEVFFPRESFT